ncbi:hypothetical protein FHS82_002073 [Pseudochelatococcus lubricantis]|uniref:Uncharacterized protein n=1 Tax=Pseudochelatococcus lubricantis TaxID=1538102 RepID=A0ABX0UZ70_9HYPH|nr:type III secretion system chaperone [Pseudochelatococcus lubricantis]NIJ58231.1 hypothetical protein [Pseudochelatococcus lubricantis]
MAIIADPSLLINSFLVKVGLPEKNFDDNDAMALTVDNTLIGIHKNDEQRLLLISSVIARIPLDGEAALYTTLLVNNFATTVLGAGSVGLDPRSEMLVYANAISLVGLDQEAFEKFLERSVNIIEDWHGLVRKVNPPTPSGAAAASNEGDVSIISV